MSPLMAPTRSAPFASAIAVAAATISATSGSAG
jgi:hypothetical protein